MSLEAKTFAGYSLESVQNSNKARADQQAPALEMTIEGVDLSTSKLNGAVYRQLRELSLKSMAFDIQKIEITGARSSFDGSGKLRADAVKEVLGRHGVDQNLVVTKGDRKSNGESVKITVYGTPKPQTTPEIDMPPDQAMPEDNIKRILSPAIMKTLENLTDISGIHLIV